MIAVDTNIIVRLLARDDEKQFQKACATFKKEAVFISDTVFLEAEWVLRFAYNFRPSAINSAFKKLLGLPNVRVANPEILAKAIKWHAAGLDFDNSLHLAKSQEAVKFLTFDARFIKKSKGLGNCQVERP